MRQPGSSHSDLCPNVAYLFLCPCSQVRYLGSTSGWVRHRIVEHKGKSFRNGLPLCRPSFSAIREHSLQHSHPLTDFRIRIPPAKISSFKNLCLNIKCLPSWTTPPQQPPCSLIRLVPTPLLFGSHILNFYCNFLSFVFYIIYVYLCLYHYILVFCMLSLSFISRLIYCNSNWRTFCFYLLTVLLFFGSFITAWWQKIDYLWNAAN